jgi:hypothetical protein
MADEQNDEQLVYSTQLPVSKIKKIAKLHPDTNMLTAEAVQTITIACVSISSRSEDCKHVTDYFSGKVRWLDG